MLHISEWHCRRGKACCSLWPLWFGVQEAVETHTRDEVAPRIQSGLQSSERFFEYRLADAEALGSPPGVVWKPKDLEDSTRAHRHKRSADSGPQLQLIVSCLQHASILLVCLGRIGTLVTVHAIRLLFDG